MPRLRMHPPSRPAVNQEPARSLVIANSHLHYRRLVESLADIREIMVPRFPVSPEHAAELNDWLRRYRLTHR